MRIEKLIDDFLLEVKLRHAKGTWRYYVSHLGHFMNYANRHGLVKVSDVTDKVLVDYVAVMKESCENITINKNISALKIMYRTMGFKNEFLQSIKKYRVRHKTFEMVPEELIKAIRKYAKDLQDIDNGLYYKTLLLLLMDTGARIQELLLIRKQDVNIDRQEILLTHTKTKEDRVVFMSQITVEAVIQMLQIKTDHQYLLHNKIANRPGNYDDVRYIMKKLKRIFSIDNLHAHMFRHSFITMWLQNGATIKEVKEVSGIKTPEVLDRYWHLSKNQARESYNLHYKLD